jgi:hypothetical protein
MPNTKPLVAVATLCEQILEEKDGVVSAIRVVDTYYVEPPKDLPAGTVAGIPLKLLLSLKSSDLTGPHEVRVVLRAPTGKSTEFHRQQIVLNGGERGEHGANLKIRFAMPANDFGLYCFDVMSGDDVLTSIPLKLILGSPGKAPEK